MSKDKNKGAVSIKVFKSRFIDKSIFIRFAKSSIDMMYEFICKYSYLIIMLIILKTITEGTTAK